MKIKLMHDPSVLGEKMSSGKAWPQRVMVNKTRGENMKYLPFTMWKDEGDSYGIEYLSLEEHSAILQEKDKEIERLKYSNKLLIEAFDLYKSSVEQREALAGGKDEKCDYCGEKIPCQNRCHVDMSP